MSPISPDFRMAATTRPQKIGVTAMNVRQWRCISLYLNVRWKNGEISHLVDIVIDMAISRAADTF